jgi:predicted amidophosphoribosyltransferase
MNKDPAKTQTKPPVKPQVRCNGKLYNDMSICKNCKLKQTLGDRCKYCFRDLGPYKMYCGTCFSEYNYYSGMSSCSKMT